MSSCLPVPYWCEWFACVQGEPYGLLAGLDLGGNLKQEQRRLSTQGFSVLQLKLAFTYRGLFSFFLFFIHRLSLGLLEICKARKLISGQRFPWSFWVVTSRLTRTKASHLVEHE